MVGNRSESDQRRDLMWRDRDSTFAEYFRGIPPLGWKLRVFFPSRWARFYANPSGNLPIKGQDEPEEMRRRFEAIESSLFGANASAISLFVPIVRHNGETGRYHPEVMSSLGLKLVDAALVHRSLKERISVFDALATR